MIISNDILNLNVVALNGNQRRWPKDSRLCWKKSLLIKEPLKQYTPSYQVNVVQLIFRFLKIVVDIFISSPPPTGTKNANECLLQIVDLKHLLAMISWSPHMLCLRKQKEVLQLIETFLSGI